jgi:hypothetical protein
MNLPTAVFLAAVNWTGAPNSPDEPGAPVLVMMYAQLVVRTPACGVRIFAWAKKLHSKLEGAIPSNRDDLQQKVRDGFVLAEQQLLDYKDKYCFDLTRDHTGPLWRSGNCREAKNLAGIERMNMSFAHYGFSIRCRRSIPMSTRCPFSYLSALLLTSR